MAEDVKLISEAILPHDKRKDASREELMDAYVELEQELIDILSDGSADFYEAFTEQLADITRQVRKLDMDIKVPDNPGFKVFAQLLKDGEPIFRGFREIRENSKLDRILVKKAKNITQKYVKNLS